MIQEQHMLVVFCYLSGALHNTVLFLEWDKSPCLKSEYVGNSVFC